MMEKNIDNEIVEDILYLISLSNNYSNKKINDLINKYLLNNDNIDLNKIFEKNSNLIKNLRVEKQIVILDRLSKKNQKILSQRSKYIKTYIDNIKIINEIDNINKQITLFKNINKYSSTYNLNIYSIAKELYIFSNSIEKSNPILSDIVQMYIASQLYIFKRKYMSSKKIDFYDYNDIKSLFNEYVAERFTQFAYEGKFLDNDLIKYIRENSRFKDFRLLNRDITIGGSNVKDNIKIVTRLYKEYVNYFNDFEKELHRVYGDKSIFNFYKSLKKNINSNKNPHNYILREMVRKDKLNQSVNVALKRKIKENNLSLIESRGP